MTFLYLNLVTNRRDANTPPTKGFGMNVQSLLVCGALLWVASLTYAGSYQRTRDGQTLVWRDVPERGDEAIWSGKRDKNGFATGSGVLTWYKVEPTIVTGSNILDNRRYVIVVNHYSGKMVRGKFEGAVTNIEADGKRSKLISANETTRQNLRKRSTRAASRSVRTTPAAEHVPAPRSERIVVDTPERTSASATTMPATEQSPSPSAEETQTALLTQTTPSAAEQTATSPEAAAAQSAPPIARAPESAAPPETAALAASRLTTRSPEQPAMQPDTRTRILPTSPAPNDSQSSGSAAPFELPDPPRKIDAETVARLDAVYQSAVKANDAAIMDEILADDFVLVTDRGASFSKADLIKEARDKRTIYDNQEVEEGTQKVRIWRDTAVVTALLRIKGSKDQNPFDYKVWVSETYVRTPTGWRYVFGQRVTPEAK